MSEWAGRVVSHLSLTDVLSDYDVFLSPLKDFQEQVKAAGLDHKLVCLDRGDQYKFSVK